MACHSEIHLFALFPVILCLLGGCSICWFNTVCHVLCIKNFPTSLPLALSLSVSFNGVSAALYTLIANAINPNDDTLYLLLNALVPLFASTLTLIPILLRRLPLQPINSADSAIHHDSLIFLILYILAAFTGVYLLFLNSISSILHRAHLLLLGAIILLLLPLCLPVIAYAREWSSPSVHYTSRLKNSSFIDPEADELHKELIGKDTAAAAATCPTTYEVPVIEKEGCFGKVIMEKDRLTSLGEEHRAGLLIHRLDFWLYFVSYFCGGTLGLVYSNNLGQISESLGYTSHTSSLVMLYSLCSFFGRLLSAAPDFLHDKVYFARTGWLAVALLPVPMALFSLAASGSEVALHAGTALIGLSSGFVFSAAVSITSELFGPNSAGINHNILITNIPIGSLFYGLVAAIVYDSNEGSSGLDQSLLKEATVCIGRKCYWQTFMWWGCFSLLGLGSSFLLFIRTRPAYDRSERNNRCVPPPSSSDNQILLCTS
ncbi:protein NUCLEAR FUSION DEFECTIVE 4 isoform X2 [Ziziphus jujuba]|uniref:Protein NUCLEAR FUSION DEFECTIVE 4 isoform X2 n=1 Tax=Ziziphus jujuba TaxID=326968 RepID=A0ABM4A9P1_ZIZJJ|nr:protein NUCLEAR FUSION DEFECTIVE 4 isoform X2 [Ziziphus jujuba]